MSARRSSAELKRDSNSPATSFSATEAQNRFGDVLDRVAEGETVYITRYNKPRAVVVSAERYRELTGDPSVDLGELTQEFDAMLARMQSPEAGTGFDALFEMESVALGEAAIKGANRGGD